jgi:ATP-dependent DNA helicase RecG
MTKEEMPEAKINQQNKILLAPISQLKGIGSFFLEKFVSLVGKNNIFHLLIHKPIESRRIEICPRIFEITENQLVIIKAKIESYLQPKKSSQPHKFICYTPTGYVNIVFFKIFPSQIKKMQIGNEIAIVGKFQKLNGENQIIHPQEIVPANEIEKLPKNYLIYPLTATISNKFISEKIQQSLKIIDGKINDWLSVEFLKKYNFPSLFEALKNLHNSENQKDFLSQNQAKKRLAYDELLAWQIATILARTSVKENKFFENFSNNLTKEFLQNLPFKLTNSQIKAIDQIEAEISSNKKMLRLLQGDVGSGKTIVAIAACLLNISKNKQSCIIVPSTILAKQHFNYCKNLLKNFEINLEILTSATTKKQREKILQNFANGQIQLVISTHAILEEDIKFKDLGLIIFDEQHKFGVSQRLKLVEKGKDVDVLLMSATPIPRSLMMTLYGDMNISILDEKPKNRQTIETLVKSEKNVEEIYEALKRVIEKKEKIFWICPAIEENEEQIEQELTSAEKKFIELSKIFDPKKIALIHGKMKEKEKEKIMNEFAFGDISILVATTVIEVGIDIPNATIIVIENSEHFGLSQLHQLRGRVGRSDKKSFCILLYGKKFGINAKKRLSVLKNSTDGFFIAEEDLKIRGSGEMLGTKQSGFPEFIIADLNFDSDLLRIANLHAKKILTNDSNLQKLENEKYRELISIFGYQECLKITRGG